MKAKTSADFRDSLTFQRDLSDMLKENTQVLYDRIKALEEENAKLRIALGQIRTMAEDCQHMSRFAADKFDTVAKEALEHLEKK